LRDAHVDVVVDIRRRRGVRGAEYAFANVGRLTAALSANEIDYLHLLDLAPSKEMLTLQHEIDRQGAGVRSRTALAPEYIRRYSREILGAADLDVVTDTLSRYARPALLCVEHDPATCHRSLAAAALAPRLGVTVEHLLPE
jgi:uncharacterized protein (DUF488 family)